VLEFATPIDYIDKLATVWVTRAAPTPRASWLNVPRPFPL